MSLLSLDSAMVYQGMDIGTGKPSREQLAEHPHAFVDCCSPKEMFSVGVLVRTLPQVLRQAYRDKRVPLLVGGTMLYLDRLLHGLKNSPPAAPQWRQALRERAEREGWQSLHEELTRLNPQRAASIHLNDKMRIERALETLQFHDAGKSARAFPLHGWQVKIAALLPSPEDLGGILKERTRKMFDDGLLEEVGRLRDDLGVTPSDASQRAVGYRQVWPCLQGQISVQEAQEQVLRATWLLSRRQRSWLRRFVRQASTPDASGTLVPEISFFASADVAEQELEHWLRATIKVNQHAELAGH